MHEGLGGSGLTSSAGLHTGRVLGSQSVDTRAEPNLQVLLANRYSRLENRRPWLAENVSFGSVDEISRLLLRNGMNEWMDGWMTYLQPPTQRVPWSWDQKAVEHSGTVVIPPPVLIRDWWVGENNFEGINTALKQGFIKGPWS